MEPYSLQYIQKHVREELMRYRDLSLPSYSSLHQSTSVHLTNFKLSALTNQNRVVCGQVYQCIVV